MPSTSLSSSAPIPSEFSCTNASQWYQPFPRPAAGVPVPCKFIRVSAPKVNSSGGVLINTGSIMVKSSIATAPGSATTPMDDGSGNAIPVQPSNFVGAWELPNSATGLNYINVSDASLIWVNAFTAGDRIELELGT